MMFLALSPGFWRRIFRSNRIDSGKFDDEYHDKPNELLDMKDFKYLKTKPKCGENDNFLFITLVHSSCLHYERRQAIRDTWGHSDPRTKTYFVMGATELASLQRKIDEEDAKYNDIIQGNFMDTYHNLTYKHTLVLKWFNANCPKVPYLLKVDDDVFVNTPAVREYLSQMPYDSDFLMGHMWKASFFLRFGKFKVTKEEMAEKYSPDFAYGHSIIYANRVAKRFYERAASTHYIFMDDMFFTGFVRMQFNLKSTPIAEYRLWHELVDRTINGSLPLKNPMFLFSSDAITGDQMRGLWRLLEPYRQQHMMLN